MKTRKNLVVTLFLFIILSGLLSVISVTELKSQTSQIMMRKTFIKEYKIPDNEEVVLFRSNDEGDKMTGYIITKATIFGSISPYEVYYVYYGNVKHGPFEEEPGTFYSPGGKYLYYHACSDEVIKDAMQIGLQMGISAKDIERVTKVAMDMSATFGTDLKTNIEMLAKAQEGQTGQLTKLLPNMKEAIKDGMEFSDVLGTIEERTNGAAAATGGTFQGSMNKLKESFSDLKEEIGKSFAPTLKIIVDAIETIISGMAKLVKQTNDIVEIQKTASYQYLFLQKQQEIYNKAIAEGWIGDTVRVLAELDKAGKQIEKQVQQANAYQEKWEKELQKQKELEEYTLYAMESRLSSNSKILISPGYEYIRDSNGKVTSVKLWKHEFILEE